MTRLADLEKDRNETEAAMSRSLQQKAQEAEALRQAMEASSESQGVSEEEMNKLQQTIDDLQRQVRSSQEQHLELERQKDRVNDLEVCKGILGSLPPTHVYFRHSFKSKLRISHNAWESTKTS